MKLDIGPWPHLDGKGITVDGEPWPYLGAGGTRNVYASPCGHYVLKVGSRFSGRNEWENARALDDAPSCVRGRVAKCYRLSTFNGEWVVLQERIHGHEGCDRDGRPLSWDELEELFSGLRPWGVNLSDVKLSNVVGGVIIDYGL